MAEPDGRRAGAGASTGGFVLVAGAVILAAVAAVAAILATRTSSPPSASARRPATLTHAEYVRFFTNALPGKMVLRDLQAWPRPYQTFTNQYRQQCFEWWDKGHASTTSASRTGC